MKAGIIDDESKAIEVVQSLLSIYAPDVEVVFTADNILDGMKEINQNQLDLLFLDIEMPNGTGLDLLKILKERPFKVIHTTAHKDYAVDAIQLGAFDYLLKPIDSDDLERMLERVRESKEELESKSKKDFLRIQTLNGFQIVSFLDITHVQGDGNYTYIFTQNGEKIVYTKNLKSLGDSLPESSFIRVHNSYIVNRNFVKEYTNADGGMVVLSTGCSVPVSRRRKEVLMSSF